MKINRITALALRIPVTLNITTPEKETSHAMCVVAVKTVNGIIRHGMTSIGPEQTIAHAVMTLAAPAIAGMNPLNNEAICDRLYWLLAPRGQTGIALHVIAAIDVALWDVRGKALGLPVWQLLGGARRRAPVYATFGFGFYDCDELADAAEKRVARGFDRSAGNAWPRI